MANNFDANIKLLYPVDPGTNFTVDDVAKGKAFEILADVEVGQDLNAVINRHDVRVGIVNLTQAKPVGAAVNFGEVLTPAHTPLLKVLRIAIADTGDAQVGDVLQAVASYKATAGVHTDFSTAQSVTFVVS